jgi:hypothetical protein
MNAWRPPSPHLSGTDWFPARPHVANGLQTDAPNTAHGLAPSGVALRAPLWGCTRGGPDHHGVLSARIDDGRTHAPHLRRPRRALPSGQFNFYEGPPTRAGLRPSTVASRAGPSIHLLQPLQRAALCLPSRSETAWTRDLSHHGSSAGFSASRDVCLRTTGVSMHRSGASGRDRTPRCTRPRRPDPRATRIHLLRDVDSEFHFDDAGPSSMEPGWLRPPTTAAHTSSAYCSTCAG